MDFLPPDPRTPCIPSGHSHTFLLRIPLVQTLLCAPCPERQKQTCAAAQTATVAGLPGEEAELASPTRLTQLLTALLRGGKGPDRSQDPPSLGSIAVHAGGGGVTSHVTPKETGLHKPEKSGSRCHSSPGEKALILDAQCWEWEMEAAHIPSCSSSLASTDTWRVLQWAGPAAIWDPECLILRVSRGSCFSHVF